MKYLTYLNKVTGNYCSGFTVISRCIHSNLLKEDIKLNFQNSLPKIVGNVLEAKKYLNLPGIQEKIQKATVYNTRPESNTGSLSLLHAYSILKSHENFKSFMEPFVLAWGIKMVHSHSLMMEGTTVQDSKTAIDADLLHSFLYTMLECHLDDYKQYNDACHLFNKVFAYHALARDIERIVPKNGDKCHDINEQRYNLLCEYKMAFKSFTLPFMLAMNLSNITDIKIYDAVESIGSEMGKLYQIKKDFDNCFGCELIIGPTGTDIQYNRCTWLAVAALQRFTDRQRLVFKSCYGSDEPAHIERVKLLYKQVNLPELFRQTQGDIVEVITRKVEDLQEKGIPSNIFLGILDEIIRDENVLLHESV